MIEEIRQLLETASGWDPAQRQTLLIVTIIRDVAYYVILGIVVWALGRRLIHAGMTAYRESRRERA